MKYLWICNQSGIRCRRVYTHELDISRGNLILGRTTDGGLEVFLGRGVVELDCTQSSSVVQPANRLGLVDLSLERRLCDKTISLFILVLGEVRAQEEVDDGDLERLVFAEGGGLTGSQECSNRQYLSGIDVFAMTHGCNSARRPCSSYTRAR